MGRTVCVNGRFVDETEARISVFDRGFLFADAVYEVSAVIDARLVDNDHHLARLARSLDALAMPPVDRGEIARLQGELIRRNALVEGLVYLQVSRGPAERDFNFPTMPVPSLVMFTQAKPLINHPKLRTGMRIISRPDIRWQRRDIKTVQLLAASLAKQAAAAAGVDDVWMVEDGLVTEGSSNNAYIVKDRTIITRALGTDILPGITRRVVLELAAKDALGVVEQPFSIAEAQAADEAFITSASTFVMPVVEIDGVAVGKGVPGPIARHLRALYVEAARRG